jgi:TonB family protein
MTINLEKDPDYKAPVNPMSNFLVVIDGVISEKSYEDAMKDVAPNQIASLTMLKDEKAADKYGEKGKSGVIEIMTRKKADELGIKIPFRRQKPDDYPTFQGASHSTFNNRVIESIQYPPDAINRGISGVVTVGFVVEPDGTISNIKAQGTADQSITDAVVNAIKESPKWEPAKNPEGQTPFSSTVRVEFKLPGTITAAEIPFVVVEQMPVYPGGDGALLDFIKNNLKYPEEARQQKIEGRVILRFAVNTLGNTEQISVLKGVHPLLDAEAFRLVGLLKDFRPGYQGGKPVPVWYMVPVTFSLEPDEKELEKLESAPAEQPH